MNVAQHKIINLLKTLFFAHPFSLVFVHLFSLWPKTPLLLPVWPTDAKSLDTSALEHVNLPTGLHVPSVECNN